METFILDFEEVLKNFTPYHESLKVIQKDKQEFAISDGLYFSRYAGQK